MTRTSIYTVFAVLLSLVIAGCQGVDRRTAQGAGIGAAAGGVIGAVTSGTLEGAAVGAAVGGATGAFIAYATRPGYCIYRDRHGRRYEARCRR